MVLWYWLTGLFSSIVWSIICAQKKDKAVKVHYIFKSLNEWMTLSAYMVVKGCIHHSASMLSGDVTFKRIVTFLWRYDTPQGFTWKVACYHKRRKQFHFGGAERNIHRDCSDLCCSMNINKVSRVKYWGASPPLSPGSCGYTGAHTHIDLDPSKWCNCTM